MAAFYSYPVLHLVTMWNNLLCAENQILMRDQSGISEEKMKEYKESFDFFDKNKSGQLDKLEFRACLLSTGYATVLPGALLKAYLTKRSFVDEALFVNYSNIM
jgi:Ca2+-binding EF-hand superfamily protein